MFPSIKNIVEAFERSKCIFLFESHHVYQKHPAHLYWLIILLLFECADSSTTFQL